ncbi:Endonuclease/exonuclease/phosphatase [Scleroderma citrinum]
MKGCSSPLLEPGPTSKWTTVMRTLREQKLGILALQETHLSDDLAAQVSALHYHRITMFNSLGINNPTGSARVAFVINKEVVNVNNISMHTLILDRAIYLSLKWQRDIDLKLINVYALNDPLQHPHFWANLEYQWRALHLPKPDFMMGHFNLTEDPIDRAPARTDNQNAIQALRTCHHTQDLQNSWCHNFPSEHTFTFTTAGHTMLRLDRIYTQKDIKDNISNWSHDTSSIPSNHKMVSLRLSPTGTPFISKDRWSWPLGLLHDKELNKFILNLGCNLQCNMKNLTKDDHTPNQQTLWQDFKDKIRREAIKATKPQIPKITQQITALKKDLKELCQQGTLDTSPSARSNTWKKKV